MPAIRQDLLIELHAKNDLSTLLPLVGLITVEEIAGETQSFGVRENVIGQQMVLNAPIQDSRLITKARERAFRKRAFSALPFDPIDDPERQGVRLPAVPDQDRVVVNPLFDQVVVPIDPLRCIFSIQVVKIMKMVEQLFLSALIVPVGSFLYLNFLVEQMEFHRADH